jgi:hypothetical protein
MAMTSSMATPDEAPLLFCPFCRECYEGETHCPDHELELVAWGALPKQAHEERPGGWDDPVAPAELRFGRAWIALGAALAIAAFFLPFASARFEEHETVWNGLEMASSRAPNLWTVPFVGAMFLWFLYRRRTPRQMQGARVAGILLALMPLASVLYTVWNVQRGAAGTYGAIAVSFGTGPWIAAAATVFFAIGSALFGRGAASDGLPHGAEPEEATPRIDTERPKPPRRRR